MPGLLDTVKFKSVQPLHDDDKRTLRKSGFLFQKNYRVRDEGSGEVVMFSEMYCDEKTGLRVLTDDFQTKIEASIPRVLGLDNVNQEYVTEGDCKAAFEKMTIDLLPYTTEKNGDQWGITRLDLARNFKGNIPVIVGAYSNLKHPEIRSKTKIMFQESVSYFGKSREMVIYDKGAEIGIVPGQLGRAECRWMGMKGVDKFVRSMSGTRSFFYRPDVPSLPVWVKTNNESRSVVYLSMSNEKLNDVMRQDLEKMGKLEDIQVFRTTEQIVLHALLYHPSEYQSFLHTMSRTTQYRWRKKMKKFKAQCAAIDVVKLIWGQGVQAAA